MKHHTIGIYFPCDLFIFTLPYSCHVTQCSPHPQLSEGGVWLHAFTECCIWTFESNLIAFIMVITMSFGCRFAQLHFLIFFLSLFCVFCCIFMILKEFFLLLGLKHLRILQLPEMSSRLVRLDHFCKCSLDESLALWPVWASYSQAKMEIYIQYINIYIHAHTHRKHA